jgi:hypothetical protein
MVILFNSRKEGRSVAERKTTSSPGNPALPITFDTSPVAVAKAVSEIQAL